MAKKKTRVKSRETSANGSHGGVKKQGSDANKKAAKSPGKTKKKATAKKRKSYTHAEWFWGLFTQEEAEEFLKNGQRGEFLVRNVLYHDNTVIIISVVAAISDRQVRKVQHLKAIPSEAHWHLDGYTEKHRTLVDLVNFYQTNCIGNTEIRLKKIAEQPDWLVKSSDIWAPRSAKRLGGGNFSTVSIGVYRRRLVAVKKLTSTGDRLMLDRAMLMKEAMIMKKMHHPYITKMIAVSVDTLQPILLVEIMATSLEDHLQKNGTLIEMSEKVLYCLQIAKGLAYMASQGLVHRDIATRNALFSRNGILKLSDFGLAEYIVNCTKTTLKKEQFPTPWLAPETMKPSEAYFNEKSDVWSFGVTCNETFRNARKPFDDLHNLAKRILKWDGVTELHKLTRAMPDGMKEIVRRCIVKNNEDRPKFEEVVVKLEKLLVLKFPLPPLHLRSVNLIEHCRPMTNCEYELLFRNNWDWQPAVRKVRREIKPRAPPKDLEKKQWKNPEKKLVKLKKKLRERRKKQKLRVRMRVWRVRRRHERKRQKVLRAIQTNEATTKEPTTKTQDLGGKQIRKKYVKLVDVYWSLMAVKWRKRAPNRETHLRLRCHRVINKKSKHPASRNGKTVRIMKTRPIRKRQDVTRPVFPKFTKRQRSAPEKKPENKKAAQKMKIKNDVVNSQAGKESSNPKKRKVRRLKKMIMRKRRKRHRQKRRRRRRLKRRRRYRRNRRQKQKYVLTMEQKDRMRLLNRRRRNRRRLLNRVKRRQKVAKLLRDWQFIRTLMFNRALQKKQKRMQDVKTTASTPKAAKKSKKSRSAEKKKEKKKVLPIVTE